MSPTPRRVKKPEQTTQKKRDRAMAAIGLIVVASMFLTLVITPGTVQERQTPELPTEGAPSALEMLTAIAEEATVQALQTAFAAAAATATPTPTPTPGATPSPAATP
jgi:hypothetical protein